MVLLSLYSWLKEVNITKVQYEEYIWCVSGSNKKTCQVVADVAWCDAICNSDTGHCPAEACHCKEEPIGELIICFKI